MLATFATADLPSGGTDYFWGLNLGGGRGSARSNNTVYVGGAGGGVWKTTDGGTTWTSTTDNQPWLPIGSITIYPSNPDTVYAGTRWPFGLYGDGILKSTNAGATWSFIFGPFEGPTGVTNFFGGGSEILSLAVNPSSSSIILAAVWNGMEAKGGVYRSADGGNTWTRWSAATYRSCTSLPRGVPALSRGYPGGR